jgi:hypothetical protein
MNLHAMHIEVVAGFVVAFFILVAAFLAIDAERIIRRLDYILTAIKALREDAKREEAEDMTGGRKMRLPETGPRLLHGHSRKGLG